MSRFRLTLFVTGQTARAERAVANLRSICDDALGGEYELVVVDVLEQPQLADTERVVATPTLIKRLPLPPRRVIGDLSDREQVLLALDLHPQTST